MKKLLPLLLLVAGFSQTATAAEFTLLNSLSPTQFRLLSEDFGSALSYKPVTPATTLGITGFDVGVEVTSTDISKSGAVLKKASNDVVNVNRLYIPKLHVAKGLPFGFDVAASLAVVPTTDIKVMGAELRYAILDGGLLLPTIGIRGAATRMVGVKELSFDTKSVDISISKGFLMFSPYAGVGQVWVNSKASARGTGGVVLDESFSQSKVFAGANLNLGLMNFALEGDRTGGATSLSFKFGFRW